MAKITVKDYMMKEASSKYKAFAPIDLPNRTWPTKQIEKAPIWCSVDLRDGNQALVTPMNLDKKLTLFKLLVKMGFKEIEVGFPSASEVEFEFVRKLIEDKLIPDDVTIQILVQAREHLIKRSFEALKGAKKAIVHLYNSTSTAQRKIVFVKEKEEIITIALDGVKWIKNEAAQTDTKIFLEYSPESFTGTELEFAAEISNAVCRQWGADKNNPVIINLPSTVEMATPNVYADQIEWMADHLTPREHIIISLHTHNDRGTSIASTELAQLAGADRVEGTLLSNGERTGNVDIITLALNLFTQGIDPKLDLSDVNKIVQTVEYATEMPTHPRHPYVGDLVYTAFSGSHQDAIKKGMKYQNSGKADFWEVPYLPIDPADVGRTYENIIRINSQSGKGGVAYILENDYGYELPKAMHREVAELIQKQADKSGLEINKSSIKNIFETHYLLSDTDNIVFKNFKILSNRSSDKPLECEITFTINGKEIIEINKGNGPIDAIKGAIAKHFDTNFTILSFHEHSSETKSSAGAIAYIHLESKNGNKNFGVGVDTDITVASIKALFSAIKVSNL